MALNRTYKKISTENPDLFIIENTTIYGTPEEDRNEGGEVLIVAHVDQDEVETFSTIDSTPYQSKLSYNVSNSKDGHYVAEFLRFQLYDPGATYSPEVRDNNNIITAYASLIFYSNDQSFYKNISASSNIAPDDPTGSQYWEKITDFTVSDIRKNTTITVGVHNFIHIDRSKICAKDELIRIGCGCSDDIKKYLPFLKKKVLLDGACSLAADLKYTQAEINIRVLETMCPTC